jgi:mono/diheme cytochrome c family protein
MNNKRTCFSGKRGAAWLHVTVIAGVFACVVLLGFVFPVNEVASIEIPPAVEKKSVSLKKSHVEAQSFFAAQCGNCHRTPDPANAGPEKPGCTKGFSDGDVSRVRNYLADVRTGKSLYESYCGRCHTLIDPGSHTLDYWSKNLCTSDECMVKKRLNSDEEQQLLLYLSSHSKKN